MISTVIVSGLYRKGSEISNLLERAYIGTRFLQPIHQGDEVMALGGQASLGVDPAFQSLFTCLSMPETDAAVADAQAHGIRISHSAKSLLDKPGM
jgi:hypothetical protein